MRSIAALVLLAGCGGAPCSATFSGNYGAAIDGAQACPSMKDGVLAFSTAGVTVSLDLGADAPPGTYGSATATRPWRAVSTREPGCAYTAGSDAVPPGTFTLDLERGTHGHLDVLQSVHALPGADCGPGDTEALSFDF